MKIVGKKFPYNIQHVTLLSSFSTFTFFTFASLIQPRYDCAGSRQPFHADLLSSAATCFFNVPAILPLGPPVPFLLSFPLFILSLSLRLDRFDGPVHGNPEFYLRARWTYCCCEVRFSVPPTQKPLHRVVILENRSCLTLLSIFVRFVLPLVKGVFASNTPQVAKSGIERATDTLTGKVEIFLEVID